MHEYSIAKELIETLTSQVEKEKLNRTKKIHLELGELRVISKDALSQAFKILTEDTIFNGVVLEFEEIPLYARCRECEFEGAVNYDDDLSLHFSVPVLSCPECGSSVEIIKGNELSVKSLTVKDSEPDD